MKEFATAAKAAVADGEDDQHLEFSIDGHLVKAYPPSSGQFAMVYRQTADYRSEGMKVAGLIDFFFGMLDEDSQQHLAQRMMDRNDEFNLDKITEILDWMMKEWAARPTSPSSGSTPLRKPTGRKSTAPVPDAELIPSNFQSTASAT